MKTQRKKIDDEINKLIELGESMQGVTFLLGRVPMKSRASKMLIRTIVRTAKDIANSIKRLKSAIKNQGVKK